ncbi:hypothetical protein F4778DRAFT_769151 [Xylariomycetidae sp. FL2044]|nr:hypothetical protein F4778DRAFT_769151 [Xylariomycetidae sp. FL2044]
MAEEVPKTLAAWYSALGPRLRTVDIVGDFGGKELFVVHGDSLLLHCITSSQVDFSEGFQLLHAVFAVEKFLCQLKSRGCKFHVVFFDDHQDLCLPAATTERQLYKYRLTRTILCQHLERCANQDEKVIHQFPSIESEEYASYLTRNAVLFILCDDGASEPDGRADHILLSQYMIHEVLRKEYSIALISSVEFRSSRLKYTGKSLRTRLTLLVAAKLWARDPADETRLGVVALICHTVVLNDASLSERAIGETDLDLTDAPYGNINYFMEEFCRESTAILNEEVLHPYLQDTEWDLYDFVDGRLFSSFYSHIEGRKPVSRTIGNEARKLLTFIDQLCGILSHDQKLLGQNLTLVPHVWMLAPATPPTLRTNSVLPFEHKVLDEFLAPIRLTVDQDSQRPNGSRIFEELSHWHNAKRAIDPKKAPRKLGFFALKRNQKFMADTLAYSASLTNASGKQIEPEVIVGNQQKVLSKSMSQGSKAPQAPPTKGSSKKAKATPKSGKQKAHEAFEAVKAQKAEVKGNTALTHWSARVQELCNESDRTNRFTKAIKFVSELGRENTVVVGAKVSLFLCDILYQEWSAAAKARLGSKHQGQETAALLFYHCLDTSKMPGMTVDIAKVLEMFGSSLGIQLAHLDSQHMVSRTLAFKPLVRKIDNQLIISEHPTAFQLQYCGPYLERTFDSQVDPRVSSFNPDAWQRSVLDGIDADKSLFIVAPTSAGKTFISFYAMKKVLQANDEDVLVYVAPTKALVNQIAAEIQARFQKSYRHEGRSVWAIHTRDYRVKNPTGCQVLVTVPHILQIMLLAPSNAQNTNPWSQRMKRIIFDEVHCIGQADDGLIWEQLLLMAPCPVIALSATVGNPQEFFSWLQASQRSKGFDLLMIQHHSRYSDLRAFFHEPRGAFDFKGLHRVKRLPVPGLATSNFNESSFRFIHPVSAIINRVCSKLRCKFSADLAEVNLEPRDALTLWEAMETHQAENFLLPSHLYPSKALTGVLTKSEVLAWSNKLKVILNKWMRDPASPFEAIRQELAVGNVEFFASKENPPMKTVDQEKEKSVEATDSTQDVSVLPLLVDLHKEGGLPAILFNYDRIQCEVAMENVLSQLEGAEMKWKASSQEWAEKLSEYKSWQAGEQKKPPTKKSTTKLSKDERVRQEANVEVSAWASFDPEAPIGNFSFADHTKLVPSELEAALKSLEDEHIRPQFFSALRRGIGVHHAGMNRRYRQVVEMLFRKGFLTVVIATGTLALGINMPCKTVSFFGDSAYLTSLNFRQGSGRAGRRGFDLLGNVVFSNISRTRAFELMSSRLPDLKGHFPLSTTLILRILGLLHATNNSELASGMMKALLSQGRLYLGGPEARMSIRHHLRFSIEYLRCQHLLSSDGTPLNFAGLVGHLYFTENAAFAFHSLLKGGYFHNLCSQIDKDPKHTLNTLTLVMAHLFGRIPARGQVSRSSDGMKSKVSSLLLPRLPQEAEKLLLAHNKETLRIFETYATTYIDQHLSDISDRHLPYTGTSVGAEKHQALGVPNTVPPPKLRSPFSVLSGFTDEFISIYDLCSTVRNGVFLEESAVPYIPIWPHDTPTPFNAYIYNFFKHGDFVALTRDNKIKKGDVWFLLKDFSLVLATIITSLTNFINPDASTDDTEMIDVEYSGETPEECNASARQAEVDLREHRGASSAGSVKQTKAAKKKRVVDSWEDDADASVSGDENLATARRSRASASATPTSGRSSIDSATPLPAWQGEGASLLDVLKAFTLLRDEFDEKFHKAWA